MVNQDGSWVGFVEGNDSYKMVVVVSKNSTRVGRNRPWKIGGRKGGLGCKASGKLGAFPFFFFFFPFLISDWPSIPFNLIGSLSPWLKLIG